MFLTRSWLNGNQGGASVGTPHSSNRTNCERAVRASTLTDRRHSILAAARSSSVRMQVQVLFFILTSVGPKKNKKNLCFIETSLISALKNIHKFSHMMAKHKKTLISNRKKRKQMMITLSQIAMPTLCVV